MRDVGYAHTTTRAIAAAAGVAEGTIYRHFPDKATLFFAAVLEANQAVVDDLASLPQRAGTRTVAAHLRDALHRLASLRADVVPLELAIGTDPELAARRDAVTSGATTAPVSGPPEALAAYLAAEQAAGRVRRDLDPWQVTTIVLAGLFGLGMRPDQPGPAAVDPIDLLADIVAAGIATPSATGPGSTG